MDQSLTLFGNVFSMILYQDPRVLTHVLLCFLWIYRKIFWQVPCIRTPYLPIIPFPIFFSWTYSHLSKVAASILGLLHRF